MICRTRSKPLLQTIINIADYDTCHPDPPSSAAAAADLSRRYPPPPPAAPIYAPVYNWTGFYIGVNGGGAFGHSTWDSAGGFNLTGGLIGGTIGFNWQPGPLVLGIESDLDWSAISGSTTNLCPLGCKTANSWLGTVRGRAGYAFDRIMPYVTGGIAFGNIKASTPGFPGIDNASTGWTVGAGLEVASGEAGPPKPSICSSTSAAPIAASTAARSSTTTPRSARPSCAAASTTDSERFRV